MSVNSVFMKKEQKDFKVDYASVLKTIPKRSYTEPQLDKNNKVEMRWRFLYIPSNASTNNMKRHVEISRKKPDSNREYLNKKMKWVEANIDPIFDRFVVKQYYYYSDQ